MSERMACGYTFSDGRFCRAAAPHFHPGDERTMSQEVRDALADAETLRGVVDELSWISDEAWSTWAMLQETDAFNADPYLSRDAMAGTRRCVALAFLAVPGLRG